VDPGRRLGEVARITTPASVGLLTLLILRAPSSLAWLAQIAEAA
jgi:hypothetical protein